MSDLRVLVIGSGGREHVLAWSLARSSLVAEVYVAPGNAGTAELATNVPIDVDDIAGLVTFATEKEIGLTVAGPELPLALGVVDTFLEAGLKIFGPTREAARLETSKAFAKHFMQERGIPTADFGIFHQYKAARQFFAETRTSGPYVVKASGLAAGKGVIVCDDLAAAQDALEQIMVDRAFGEAGDEVVIEERLYGPEVSLLAFSDGRTVVPMLPARDHKRAYDNDEGPNTGGMGAYSPPPEVDQVLVDEVMRTVLQPTISGMADRGTPYVGVLYAGLMLTDDGPQVLEFNCRFGDPEAQVIVPLMESDMAEVMLACIEGRLNPDMVRHRLGACATVVMAAPGYPGSYPKGAPITGVETIAPMPNVTVFQAGTRRQDEQLVTNGGRVLAVSAWGDDLATAVMRAYQGVDQIHFEGVHYRRDIGRSFP